MNGTKKILPLIFIFSLFSSYAADFIYPELVDVGEVNIRHSLISKDLKYGNQNYKSIKQYIKNTSNEIIYLIAQTNIHDNDSSILKNNVALAGTSYIAQAGDYIAPNDSVDISFRYIASEVDSISASGEYLYSTYRLYYRKESSLKIDSIDIRYRYKAVDRDELIIFGCGTAININKKSSYGENAYTSKGLIFLTNLTSNSILVDSIQYEFEGENYTFKGYYLGDSSVVPPFTFDINKRLIIELTLRPLKPETSKFSFKIFGRDGSSNEQKIISDSLIVHFLVNKELFITGNLSMKEYNWEVNDTTEEFDDNRAVNYTDSTWYLSEVYSEITGTGEVLLNLPKPLPILLEADSSLLLGTQQYTNPYEGKDTVKLNFVFTNDASETVRHSIVYYYKISPATSVEEPQNTKDVFLYPNPADEYTKICFNSNISQNISVIFYDLKGKEVLSKCFTSSEINKELMINCSGLEPGYYIVVIHSNSEVLTQPLIIIR